MYDNNVMEVVENIPTDANIIGTKWFFAEKDDKKKKARLVALGCQQVEGESYYWNLFSNWSIGIV